MHRVLTVKLLFP